jgi:Mrp family chromosome partitioning ATPase
MGKIRDTFRLVRDGRNQAPASAAEAPALPEDEGPVEVPFIEVGPRRQVEASPDVLACPGPASAALPRPHHVLFRGLPQAKVSPLPPELVAYHSPNEAASAEYAQLLATALVSAEARVDGPKVLLFTGTRARARTTAVVLNLAITAARQGQRVVVIDANLRRPALAARLGLEAAPGLTEVLQGAVALREALRPTAQDGLRVLAAGAPQALWLEGDELRALLREAADGADLVFVDGPSWEGRSGAAACAQASDVTFLVVPGAEADVPPASELTQALPGRGVKLAGCVLTAG